MNAPAKVLVIDESAISFQVWQCVARVLGPTTVLELHHATDASEGLSAVEDLQPDVIVLNLDEELEDEYTLFIEGLYGEHPPIIIPNHSDRTVLPSANNIIRVNGGNNVNCIHQALLTAATAAQSASAPAYLH